jgi:hypothetical protein
MAASALGDDGRSGGGGGGGWPGAEGAGGTWGGAGGAEDASPRWVRSLIEMGTDRTLGGLCAVDTSKAVVESTSFYVGYQVLFMVLYGLMLLWSGALFVQAYLPLREKMRRSGSCAAAVRAAEGRVRRERDEAASTARRGRQPVPPPPEVDVGCAQRSMDACSVWCWPVWAARARACVYVPGACSLSAACTAAFCGADVLSSNKAVVTLCIMLGAFVRMLSFLDTNCVAETLLTVFRDVFFFAAFVFLTVFWVELTTSVQRIGNAERFRSTVFGVLGLYLVFRMLNGITVIAAPDRTLLAWIFHGPSLLLNGGTMLVAAYFGGRLLGSMASMKGASDKLRNTLSRLTMLLVGELVVFLLLLVAFLVRSAFFSKYKTSQPWVWFWAKIPEKIFELISIIILAAAMTTKADPNKDRGGKAKRSSSTSNLQASASEGAGGTISAQNPLQKAGGQKAGLKHAKSMSALPTSGSKAKRNSDDGRGALSPSAEAGDASSLLTEADLDEIAKAPPSRRGTVRKALMEKRQKEQEALGKAGARQGAARPKARSGGSMPAGASASAGASAAAGASVTSLPPSQRWKVTKPDAAKDLPRTRSEASGLKLDVTSPLYRRGSAGSSGGSVALPAISSTGESPEPQTHSTKAKPAATETKTKATATKATTAATTATAKATTAATATTTTTTTATASSSRPAGPPKPGKKPGGGVSADASSKPAGPPKSPRFRLLPGIDPGVLSDEEDRAAGVPWSRGVWVESVNRQDPERRSVHYFPFDAPSSTTAVRPTLAPGPARLAPPTPAAASASSPATARLILDEASYRWRRAFEADRAPPPSTAQSTASAAPTGLSMGVLARVAAAAQRARRTARRQTLTRSQRRKDRQEADEAAAADGPLGIDRFAAFSAAGPAAATSSDAAILSSDIELADIENQLAGFADAPQRRSAADPDGWGDDDGDGDDDDEDGLKSKSAAADPSAPVLNPLRLFVT